MQASGKRKSLFPLPLPAPKKRKRACCRCGAAAPQRQHALYYSGVGTCCESERLLRSPDAGLPLSVFALPSMVGGVVSLSTHAGKKCAGRHTGHKGWHDIHSAVTRSCMEQRPLCEPRVNAHIQIIGGTLLY